MPRVACEVSTSGDWPVTTTLSCTPPTASLKSTRDVSPTDTEMPERVTGLKPEMLAFTA